MADSQCSADLRALKRKFYSQRNGAKRRGIEFKLTFDEWLQWWGEDIALRGPKRDQLGMQRPWDTGPYELGNIRKGTPAQNAKTAGSRKSGIRASSFYTHKITSAVDLDDVEDEFAFLGMNTMFQKAS